MADVRAVCVDGPCEGEVFDVDDGERLHLLRGKRGSATYRLTDTPAATFDTLAAKAFAAEWVASAQP